MKALLSFPRTALCTVILAASCAAQSLPAYNITTAIGIGTAGYTGDGSAASAAQLNYPMAMLRGSDGTLYIADTFNAVIRTVKSDGIIRTIVGTGVRGFSNDGVVATAALINSPYGMAFDSTGRLYFTDSLNNTIRRLNADGTISLIGGTGLIGFQGDGGDAKLANIYLPTGIVVDPAGNIIFSDTQNNRVRKIDTKGIITTVAGDGTPHYAGDGLQATVASLNYPTGLALDSAGNLYIADTYNQAVRKVSAATGIITTVAGTGKAGYNGDFLPATSSALNYPRGLYVDASGTVYIADTTNNRIRAVTEDGLLRPVAGGGYFGDSPENIPAYSAPLMFPRGVVPDGSGGFYLLDTDNNKIRKLTPQPTNPVVSKEGVVSLSDFGGLRTAASGSWIEIYGSSLAQGTRSWTADDFVNGKAPTKLSGTSVTIGGVPAYVSYISPGQINALVPETLPAGTYDLVVNTAQGASTPYRLTLLDAQPGIYAPVALKKDGKQYAGVVLPDGTIVTPDTKLRPGDIVALYGIGFGAVAPQNAAGEVVRSANSIVRPVRVFFGDTPAGIQYAGQVPGTLGLYVINVIVPQMSGDAIPLRLELNGTAAQQTLVTAVGN